jgi:5-(carboxyamino)imidazole ribonucleotide mutase
VAAETVLPVIAVPLPGGALNGVDALYAMVQMPGGVPVATMAIGKAGAKNAGLFAVQILSTANPALLDRLLDYKARLAAEVAAKDAALQQQLGRVFP